MGKAHKWTLRIYKVTRAYPSEKKFGLVSQLRRAASSIPTNLAEGCKRKSKKDFAHFVNMAEASLEETKYILLLSRDLEYLQQETFDELQKNAEEIGKMLSGLYKSLAAHGN